MKTPLFFKALLLLVLAIRLLLAAKKSNKTKNVPYEVLNIEKFTRLPIKHDKNNPILSFKQIYRNQMGDKRQEMNIFSLTDSLIKSLEKGNIYRFIWHQNHLVYAFCQALVYLDMNDEATLYEKTILDYTGIPINKLNPSELSENLLFPQQEKTSMHQALFEQSFALEGFVRKLLCKLTICE